MTDITAAGEQHQVLARVCIRLCSKPCQRAEPAAEVTLEAPKRAGLAVAGKNASIKAAALTSSSAAAAAAASAAPTAGSSNSGADGQQPQQQLQHVQVSLSGLDGLQQELPAATGSWVQVAPGQSCQCLDVPLPDTQLVVSEQRVRSWAAAAAQLSLNITISNPPAADAAPKKAGAAGAAAAAAGAKAGAVPAATAVASGSLLLNCAGLLTGDSAAGYSWGSMPPPAAAAAAAAAAPADAGAAIAVSAGSGAAAASSAAGQEDASRFKWAVQPPTGTLRDWLAAAEVVLQVFRPPAATVPDPHTGAKAAAAAGKPPSATAPAAAKHGTAPAARLSTTGDAAGPAEVPALEPCSLLSPALAAVLNPIVLYARKASCLPDAPATRQQLDSLCEAVKLRVLWPTLAPGVTQAAASTSPWATAPSAPDADAIDALAVRTATFAAPVVVLGCDMGQQALTQLCRSKGVQLQVHDRTAPPEPAPFTAARMQQQKQLQLQQQQQAQQASGGKGGSRGSAAGKQAAGRAGPLKAPVTAAQAPPAPAEPPVGSAAAAAAAAESTAAMAAGPAAEGTSALVAHEDGQVFAAASVSLLDLVRGRSSCCFTLQLQPVSTLRGGSCLGWKGRPGRYLEANSTIKGWVRAAVPLHAMQPSIEAAAAAMAAASAAKDAAATAAAGGSSMQAAVAAEPGAAAGTAAGAGAPAGAAGPLAGSKAARRTTGTQPSSSSVAAAAGTKAPATATTSAAGVAAGGLQAGPGRSASTVGSAAEGVAARLLQPPDHPKPEQRQQQQQLLPQAAAYVMLPSAERFQGHLTTAVFMMDYRDSYLLHVIEDSVRQHNAMALGLAPPPPPTPEQLAAAARAAEEAAEAAAAAMGPLRGRPRPSSDATSAAGASKLQSKLQLGQGSKAPTARPTAGAPAAGGGGTTQGSDGSKPAGAVGAAAAAAAAQDAQGALASKAAARRSSAGAALQQAGTPRSTLKQPLAAAGAAGLAAEASAVTSGGLASSRQQQQQQQLNQLHPRASFAVDLGSSCSPGARAAGSCKRDEPSCSEDESSEEEEEQLSEADQRLQVALQQYEHVELDQRLLQVLSTYQLSPDQVSDVALDVLTGFQVVDGDLRLFVVEGPAGGSGMQHLVPAMARWALEDQEDELLLLQQQQAEGGPDGDRQQREQQWLRRQVLLNPSIRHPLRRYGCLGVDLWMLKLRASLAVLGASASTFTGHVRPACLAGMKCLLGMVQGYFPTGKSPATTSSKGSGTASPGKATKAGQTASACQQQQQGPRPSAGGVVLMRQVDACQLLPTAEQLHLVDKKFGGELTAADVLGIEAEDDLEEDDDDTDTGRAAHTTKAASPQHGTAASAAAGSGAGPAKAPTTLAGAHAAAAKAASARMQLLLAEDGADVRAYARAAEEAGAAKEAQSLASRRRSGKGTSTSRRSRSRSRRHGRRSSMASKKKLVFKPKHALDMDNSVYLHLRMEAHRRREQRDICAEHLQALTALSVARQPLREAWHSWNPQRGAAQELQRQVEAGTLTLEDAMRAHTNASPSSHKQQQQQALDPSRLDTEQAQALGWCPHSKPFMWPAPRDPASYNTHDLKPSDYRIVELQEPWTEGGLAAAAHLSNRDASTASTSFNCLIRPIPNSLFTQDPGFWKSVHTAGDAWEEQVAQHKAVAAAEAAGKVVVKDVHFHGLPGTGDKAAAQADRLHNLLKSQPLKKGFKVTYVPPPPVSMYSGTPWEPSSTALAGSLSSSSMMAQKADKTKWVAAQDFDALCNKQRSALAKPGFSDAATAALHDHDDEDRQAA